jgi:hypothetical protein
VLLILVGLFENQWLKSIEKGLIARGLYENGR